MANFAVENNKGNNITLQQQNLNMYNMKKGKFHLKTLGVVLAALMLAPLATSCDDGVLIESVRTDYDDQNFTVTNDLWTEDPVTHDFWCSFEWSAITDEAIRSGNVHAYLLSVRSGAEYQNPLPYVYAQEYLDITGNTVYEPVNIHYEIEPEHITFVISPLNNLYLLRTQLETKRFRVVVNTPVTYILED